MRVDVDQGVERLWVVISLFLPPPFAHNIQVEATREALGSVGVYERVSGRGSKGYSCK